MPYCVFYCLFIHLHQMSKHIEISETMTVVQNKTHGNVFSLFLFCLFFFFFFPPSCLFFTAFFLSDIVRHTGLLHFFSVIISVTIFFTFFVTRTVSSNFVVNIVSFLPVHVLLPPPLPSFSLSLSVCLCLCVLFSFILSAVAFGFVYLFIAAVTTAAAVVFILAPFVTSVTHQRKRNSALSAVPPTHPLLSSSPCSLPYPITVASPLPRPPALLPYHTIPPLPSHSRPTTPCSTRVLAVSSWCQCLQFLAASSHAASDRG